ncbi:M20/M25/M40 family metallo-hydrolase [Leptobacterium sp. I13]|uniref:M20/M25/M40 family metallo-hydrolase n=1 Tax=Leptobacterium meishanense TaxID=3128904 RepID=UPI0030EC439B
MKSLRLFLTSLFACFLTTSLSFGQQTEVDSSKLLIDKIKEEASKNSELEVMAHYLFDINGPRLTASPGIRKAGEWMQKKLNSWNMDNVRMEEWGTFGKGWKQINFSGRVLTPFIKPLQGLAMPWSGSTNGKITAPVSLAPIKNKDASGYPEITTSDHLKAVKGNLEGSIVMLRPPSEITIEDNANYRFRLSEEDFFGSREHAVDAEKPAANLNLINELIEGLYEKHAIQEEILATAGVKAVLLPSTRDHGVIRHHGNWAGIRAEEGTNILPRIVLSKEQYNWVYRTVSNGQEVKIELDIENKFYPEDTGFNILGEIKGSMLPEEYVVLGAHMDSWTWGVGAIDNGSGVLIIMEAMRILKALDIKPKRTILAAFWGGEEQGILGSQKWVASHIDLNNKISAYFNLDNGTGKIVGVRDQYFHSSKPVLDSILAPIKDLGVLGARHSATGSSDHLPFYANNIPAFTFIQDPLEYELRVQHSQLDTYDHLSFDDLKQASIVAAYIIYTVANRNDLMPRD